MKKDEGLSEIFEVLSEFLQEFKRQFFDIAPYWGGGILIGSVISIFAKEKINKMVFLLGEKQNSILGIVFAAILGILSPLCMYGTIPIAAVFYKRGIKQETITAFMMSSILLNPQLMFFSLALGYKYALLRFFAALFCCICAGLLIKIFYKHKEDRKSVV